MVRPLANKTIDRANPNDAVQVSIPVHKKQVTALAGDLFGITTPSKAKTSWDPTEGLATAKGSLNVGAGTSTKTSASSTRAAGFAAKAKSSFTTPGVQAPPDPHGAKVYSGIPTEKGGTNTEGSHARAIGNWIIHLREATTTGGARKVATDLQTAEGVLADTITDTKKDVNKALQRDIKSGGIHRLDKASNGQAQKYVGEYKTARKEVGRALVGLEAARATVGSAQASVDAATASLKKHELTKYQNEKKSQRKAIEARIKQRTSMVTKSLNMAVGLVTDPKGTLKKYGWDKLQEAAIDIVSEQDRAKLVDLDVEIAAVNKQISQLTDTVAIAKLQVARKQLEAAKHKLIEASLVLAGAREMAWRSVDKLARLEKRYPGRSTVFGKLQAHYAQTAKMGKAVHTLSGKYVAALGSEPFSRTKEIHDRIADDRKSVNYLRESDANRPAIKGFHRYADHMDRYVSALEAWKQKEIAAHKKLQRNIEGGAHLAGTGQVLSTIATKVFGETYDPDSVSY